MRWYFYGFYHCIDEVITTTRTLHVCITVPATFLCFLVVAYRYLQNNNFSPTCVQNPDVHTSEVTVQIVSSRSLCVFVWVHPLYQSAYRIQYTSAFSSPQVLNTVNREMAEKTSLNNEKYSARIKLLLTTVQQEGYTFCRSQGQTDRLMILDHIWYAMVAAFPSPLCLHTAKWLLYVLTCPGTWKYP